MIRKILFFLMFIGCFGMMNAQKDSIFISAKLEEEQELSVKQKIIYHNPLDKSISKIKILNWLAAYQKKETPLAKRKLENGRTTLYFAEKTQLGGILDLKISIDGQEIENLDALQENIYLPLKTPLEAKERKEIELSYKIHFPAFHFTMYGKDRDEIFLKYFFLVPDTFEDENQSAKYFLDLEETQDTNSYWRVDFQVPEYYFLKSNLPENEQRGSFQGEINTDVEFYLSPRNARIFTMDIDGAKVNIELAYPIENKDVESLEFYLPLHLKFIKERLGWLPPKILISPKDRKENSFLGNEDIRLWNIRLPLFANSEKVDLDYFSLISYHIIDQLFIADKDKAHWLKNGLKTYLEAQYLKKFYAQHPLVGNIKNWTILGMKPFKWLNVSKLKLIDRYGVGYQYAVDTNSDQAIGENYSQLENHNHIVNQFEMGLLLDFVAEREGYSEFEKFIKNYVNQFQGKEIQAQDFLNNLVNQFGSHYNFIRDFINKKQRVDFALKSMKWVSDNLYQIRISKNTLQNIPFKLEVKDKDGTSQWFWLDTEKNKKESDYQLTLSQPQKLIINPNYGFLESNFRNNFSEKRWFGFAKKVKFKLFTDVPNPEFNEIYLNPDMRFNIYDDLLLGLNFSNISLTSPSFSYSVTPYMSIGEWKLTGGGNMSYKIQPVDTFFNRLVFGASGAYFHYNHNLAYRKISLFVTMDLKQEPRSLASKTLNLSYQYIDRDLPEEADLSKNYAQYGLWTLGFYWKDRHPIHEKWLATKVQLMRDFQKLSVEGIYYWEFAPKKQAQFRFFGGWFMQNKTKNRAFDFGVSKINDYNFSYSLLGQSAVSGLFAQEFILAEGGFKSYVGGRASQWIVAFNVDIPVWKVLSVYSDAGMYKNKGKASNLVWDSGIKISVLPRILEVYFPIQSSLGFEPILNNYEKRIRFSLNLELNNIVDGIRRIIK